MDPATFLALNSVLGPYVPLRTACLFTCGKKFIFFSLNFFSKTTQSSFKYSVSAPGVHTTQMVSDAGETRASKCLDVISHADSSTLRPRAQEVHKSWACPNSHFIQSRSDVSLTFCRPPGSQNNSFIIILLESYWLKWYDIIIQASIHCRGDQNVIIYFIIFLSAASFCLAVFHSSDLWYSLSRHLSCLRSWQITTESGGRASCRRERRVEVFLRQFRSWRSALSLQRGRRSGAQRRHRPRAPHWRPGGFPPRRPAALSPAAAVQDRHLRETRQLQPARAQQTGEWSPVSLSSIKSSSE